MSEKTFGDNFRVDEVLREVYLNIHSREINQSEMGLIKQALVDDPSGTIIAMLRSPELLSNLMRSDPILEVASNALNYVLRSIKTDEFPAKRFFLHVPKSGGTSIIHHLNEHSDLIWFHAKAGTHLDFWPLVAGHFHWSAFPSDSKGFTIFRDPLKRMISLWRFSTSYSQSLSRIADDPVILNFSFTDWLNAKKLRGNFFHPLISWFFTDTPTSPLDYEGTRSNELEKSFNNFYTSFEHFGCIEDPDSVDRALAFATGNEASLTKTKNQTDATSDPQTLSKAEYDRLFELTSFDYRFFNHLFEKGIITHDYNQNKEENLIQYLNQLGLMTV